MRRATSWLAGVGLVVASATVAIAGPKPTATVPIAPQVAEHAAAAQVLYFNRCVGGCTITKSGTNDARSRASTIPRGSVGDQFMMTEFRHGDAVWNDLMQCLREVYSPYNVTITDQLPAPGVAYNENIVAGADNEIGVSAGGIAPVTSDCSPYSYVISYTFANDYGPDVNTLCYVAAQETGHAYGMADHSWSFISDDRSACSDPMSYRQDCLTQGQRFFRNEAATCGDFAQEQCNCAGMNSHAKLLAALGAGTPITPPPTVTVTQPAAGPIASGAMVIANAKSVRGITKVELWLNGFKWGERKGVPFGQTEQPEAAYALPIPAEVPDGVIDIQVIAKDDIGMSTTAPTITVTKGAPCATADTCLAGQKCEAGKCFWDPPSGAIGDVCTYPQFCLSGTCTGPAGEDQLCTQSCIPNVGDSCPMGFTCLETAPAQGVCWPESAEEGGCCSASSEGAAQTALLALGLLAILAPRRRRRRYQTL